MNESEKAIWSARATPMQPLTAAKLCWHLPVDEWQDPEKVAAELGATAKEVLTIVFNHQDFEYSEGMIRRVAY